MTFEQVKEYLVSHGYADRIHHFDLSSATVELAAQRLGCEPCRIAKTMSFLVDDAPVLVVLAGDVRVHNAAFKAAFHQKAKMLSHEQVSALTGYPVGGVCPFLAPANAKVYLDESHKRFDTVFPAVGDPNSAVELSIPELETLVAPAGWVNVSNS